MQSKIQMQNAKCKKMQIKIKQENLQSVNVLIHKEYEKLNREKQKKAKQKQQAIIWRSKDAQKNVKYNADFRKEVEAKNIRKVFSKPNKFDGLELKNTNGGFKEGTKINTSRSKWEKIKEPEENIYFQLQENLQKEFENEKAQKSFESAIILDLQNKKGYIVSGFVKRKILNNYTMISIKRKYDNTKFYATITEFAGRGLNKNTNFEIEYFKTEAKVKVKLEDLIKQSLITGIKVYEINRFWENEKEKEKPEKQTKLRKVKVLSFQAYYYRLEKENRPFTF